MRAIADTHTAIWYLWKPENLSSRAVEAVDESVKARERIGISAITLCEVVYLAERQRIRSDAFELFMDAICAADDLFEEVPLDSAVASMMRSIPRSAIPGGLSRVSKIRLTAASSRLGRKRCAGASVTSIMAARSAFPGRKSAAACATRGVDARRSLFRSLRRTRRCV
jgi:PIN domain nuclease of toxin-antitoxin system